MDKGILQKHFDAFLQKPDQKALGKLTADLERYRELPSCPECSSRDVVKFGTNPRKHGPTQQYRCKECGHIYSDTSIENRSKRDRYPSCPRCGGRLEKHGSWSWVLKNGTMRKRQKYHCISCNHYARFRKIEPRSD